ncbi:hypothetical protein BD324DRAFT_634040 [Kockovaella imperatae]|uniref:N-acetyltransferase domain-containing protein n=1 Tax=Kockovaella imperatae TaxID=4999 RepID=A0A1Y1UAT5_9TREE|nr:hypothetical protein BD324DRAFT_634040 [Kockovaella imperatae]ORX35143.1 hypothetical protein BD324DRAFT_634040 [Kockovaella imperatae]
MSSSSSARAHVQWDEERSEPYMIIPAVPSIRFTPLRSTDGQNFVDLYNDPEGGQYAFRRPYPYDLECSQWFMDNFHADLDMICASLKSHLEHGTRPPATTFPLAMMRYVPTCSSVNGSTATDSSYSKLDRPDVDQAVEDRLSEMNLSPDTFLGSFTSFPNTNDIANSIGETSKSASRTHMVAYDLMPFMRGKGVGTRALDAVLEGWNDWVGVEETIAHIQESNVASRTMIRRCGFDEVDSEIWQWPLEKGGGERRVFKYVRGRPKDVK